MVPVGSHPQPSFFILMLSYSSQWFISNLCNPPLNVLPSYLPPCISKDDLISYYSVKINHQTDAHSVAWPSIYKLTCVCILSHFLFVDLCSEF